MPLVFFTLLVHLIACAILTTRAMLWSRHHPMGADPGDLLLPPALFASVSGGFIALPTLLFSAQDLSIAFSKPLDTDTLLAASPIAIALLIALPAIGLSPKMRKKVGAMALLGSVATLATVFAFLSFLYLRTG